MLNKGAPTLLPTAQEPPHAQCARTGRPSPDREMLGSSQGQAHRAGRAMLELCLRCIWQRRPEVFPHCQGQSMIALWCVRIPPDCSWQRRLAGPSRQSPDRCHGWRSSRDGSAGPVVCNDRQPATLAAQAMPCTATGRGKNGVLTNIPSSWIVQSATTEGTGFVSVLRPRCWKASRRLRRRRDLRLPSLLWARIRVPKGGSALPYPCGRHKKSQYVWAAMVASWIRLTG
jgi:hypothetical protein